MGLCLPLTFTYYRIIDFIIEILVVGFKSITDSQIIPREVARKDVDCIRPLLCFRRLSLVSTKTSWSVCVVVSHPHFDERQGSSPKILRHSTQNS